MANRTRIGLIGCGKMGGALITALVHSGVVEGPMVLLYDRDPKALDTLVRSTGAVAMAELRALFSSVEIAFLAVKPQDMPDLLEELEPVAPAPDIVVSIAAGFPLARLRSRLPATPNLVRAMPNRPALVRAGITALMGDDATSATAVSQVETLLQAAGKTVRLAEESWFDAVTALSGSGPAFVCRLVEGLVAGGVASGLSEPVALALATHTVLGTGKLLVDLAASPRAEREAVTSPGGTTLAGLEVLERQGFHRLVSEAVQAAAVRSRELGAWK
ncbi:MAG: pyrroline-5-carboxylate reductase [Bradymonadales bacterium]|nr:pyrroline-5-carboxylate reductase [Bradymonadales bacterium]